MKQNKETQPVQPSIDTVGWTKGKAETEYSLDGSVFIKCGERYIAIAQSEDGETNPEDKANAERIVECWNGYEGLKYERDAHKTNWEVCLRMYDLSTKREQALKAENEALKEARSESMKHIANLNGEITELKEALKELIYVAGYIYEGKPALIMAKELITKHFKP